MFRLNLISASEGKVHCHTGIGNLPVPIGYSPAGFYSKLNIFYYYKLLLIRSFTFFVGFFFVMSKSVLKLSNPLNSRISLLFLPISLQTQYEVDKMCQIFSLLQFYEDHMLSVIQERICKPSNRNIIHVYMEAQWLTASSEPLLGL